MSLTALGSYLISRQRVTSNEQNKCVPGSDKITIINICSSHIIADQSMVKNGFFKYILYIQECVHIIHSLDAIIIITLNGLL